MGLNVSKRLVNSVVHYKFIVKLFLCKFKVKLFDDKNESFIFKKLHFLSWVAHNRPLSPNTTTFAQTDSFLPKLQPFCPNTTAFAQVQPFDLDITTFYQIQSLFPNRTVRIISLPKQKCARLAQLVRSLTANQEVPGSIPGLVEG